MKPSPISELLFFSDFRLDDWCRHRSSAMTAALMTLHIAAHAERLSAACMCASEWLLASVAMRVNSETGWTRKSFVACTTDIALVVLRVLCCGRKWEVVVMLPALMGDRWEHGWLWWNKWWWSHWGGCAMCPWIYLFFGIIWCRWSRCCDRGCGRWRTRNGVWKTSRVVRG